MRRESLIKMILMSDKIRNWTDTPMPHITILLGLLLLGPASANAAEDRRQRVLDDRAEVQAAGSWVYNDLAQGFTEAAKTRKPMLVIFRCVP